MRHRGGIREATRLVIDDDHRVLGNGDGPVLQPGHVRQIPPIDFRADDRAVTLQRHLLRRQESVHRRAGRELDERERAHLIVALAALHLLRAELGFEPVRASGERSREEAEVGAEPARAAQVMRVYRARVARASRDRISL